jgi:opacity protein-like surface antigen
MHSVRLMRLFIILTVLGGVGALPNRAAAQSVAEEQTWTVTPLLSGSFGTSNDLGSSLGLGVAVGYDMTRNVGVEVELAHVFDVSGDDARVDWSLTNISANAIYHFDVPHVTPYATFGLGPERSSISVKDPTVLALTVPSSTEMAFNFGGGVKYSINEKFLARADLRRFQAMDAAPDHWRLYGGVTWWIKR